MLKPEVLTFVSYSLAILGVMKIRSSRLSWEISFRWKSQPSRGIG